MSNLIIGGLIVVALLAVTGAFLLARGVAAEQTQLERANSEPKIDEVLEHKTIDAPKSAALKSTTSPLEQQSTLEKEATATVAEERLQQQFSLMEERIQTLQRQVDTLNIRLEILTNTVENWPEVNNQTSKVVIPKLH